MRQLKKCCYYIAMVFDVRAGKTQTLKKSILVSLMGFIIAQMVVKGSGNLDCYFVIPKFKYITISTKGSCGKM